ncbi:MAG TPA: VWA domain-containing protein [Thermoanaerobaculia bacterium]|nr:VWA domain-containing protein [Thermoanaerobaculia bacterium]
MPDDRDPPSRLSRRARLSTLFLFAVVSFCLASLAPAATAKPGDKPAKLTRAEKAAQKKAVAALPQVYRDWLDEVDVLITPDEVTAFLALDKDYQRDAFIERFWESRNKFQGVSGNEFRDLWNARVQEARSHYGSLKEDRARVFLLNGPAAAITVSQCSEILWPLEVWYYNGSERAHFEFIVIFFQKWGAGPYRIWEPMEGAGELFRDSASREERSLNAVASGCRDGDRIAGAINWVLGQGMGYGMIQAKFDSRPTGPGGEWIAAFHAYSTDLPETAPTFNAKLDFDYPGRHQERTVVEGVIQVPVSEVGQAKLGEHRSYNFVLTGEVLQGRKLFDSFRYKFDFPLTDVHDGSLPLVFQRYLRPGTYNLIIKVEDLNSAKFFRSEHPLVVPQTDKIAPAPLPSPDSESGRLLLEANAALSTGETTLKVVKPQGEFQTGMQRFETLTTGTDIARMTFALDGKPILTKNRAPYSVELDLGPVPRPRTLTATAYDAKGNEVARDQLLINAAGHRFAVHLLEPHRGKRYQSSLLANAATEVPEEQTVERVEFYLNESLVATLYQPPYVQPIVLPKSEALSYVRAVAYLADGNSTEDLVFVNSDVEQIKVQFVELYTSVLDRAGRPVEGMAQKDFIASEDGVKQQIVRFEQVRDLPIHAAIAIDISASMEPALPEARQAALQFFEQTVKPKDRAALITFNDHPNLAVKFTNDVTSLAGGLAGLKAERGTALYDSIVFSLFYFNGIKGQRAILLLSDGRDEGSRFTFEDALDYARRAGVTIYSIGLGKEVDKKHLSKLAEETGGRSFFVQSAAELAAIYAGIERDLRSQYLIAYQSTNSGDDNTFRTVELKCAQPGLEVKTIRGYYP